MRGKARSSLERLLEQRSTFHGSPADEQDGLRSEVVAEVDVLESFLTGLLSSTSEPAQRRGRKLVEDQFAEVETALLNAREHDIGRLAEYVRHLKDAYLQYRRHLGDEPSA